MAKELKTAEQLRAATLARVKRHRERKRLAVQTVKEQDVKPFKVIRIGGPKLDGADPLDKAFETVKGWKGVVNLRGDESPVFRTRARKVKKK